MTLSAKGHKPTAHDVRTRGESLATNMCRGEDYIVTEAPCVYTSDLNVCMGTLTQRYTDTQRLFHSNMPWQQGSAEHQSDGEYDT